MELHKCSVKGSIHFAALRQCAGLPSELEQSLSGNCGTRVLQGRKSIRVLGALNASHLNGAASVDELPAEAAAPFAFHGKRIWLAFGLRKESDTKYKSFYRECMAGALRDGTVVGPFTGAGIVWHPTNTRQCAVRRLTGVAAVFVVALEGVAIVTQRPAAGAPIAATSTLQIGEACVFCPEGSSLNIEVEGASSLFLATCFTADESGKAGRDWSVLQKRCKEVQAATANFIVTHIASHRGSRKRVLADSQENEPAVAELEKKALQSGPAEEPRLAEDPPAGVAEEPSKALWGWGY